jgi:hypothetical protein
MPAGRREAVRTQARTIAMWLWRSGHTRCKNTLLDDENGDATASSWIHVGPDATNSYRETRDVGAA